MPKPKVTVKAKPQAEAKKKKSKLDELKSVCDPVLVSFFAAVFATGKKREVTLMDLTEAAMQSYGLPPASFRAMMLNVLVDVSKLPADETMAPVEEAT